jgi:hypothetical protein
MTTKRTKVVPCVSGAEFIAFVESLNLDPASLDDALEGIAVGREHDREADCFPPFMDVVEEIRATGFSVNAPALLAELEND